MIYLLVEGDGGEMFYYLHSGDFRYDPSIHSSHPLIADTRFNCVFLDTTYLQPQHSFPSQQQVIDQVCDVCSRLLTTDGVDDDDLSEESLVPQRFMQRLTANKTQLKPLAILVGSYLIGKERLFIAISRLFNSRVYAVGAKKFRILEAVLKHCPEFADVQLVDGEEGFNNCTVHVCSMQDLSLQRPLIEEQYLSRFECVLTLRPTGWTFTNNNTLKQETELGSKSPLSVQHCSDDGRLLMLNVGYSEHSSFDELYQFSRSLSFYNLQSTVSPNTPSTQKHIKEWISERKPIN